MNFPNKTSPFWNMSQNEEKTHAKKIDVILGGMETIGSAERSTSPHEMRHMFEEISEGGYAKLLYELLSKFLHEFKEIKKRKNAKIGLCTCEIFL